MQKLFIGFFSLIISIGFANDIETEFDQPASLKNEARYLSLKDAIEEGLRKNFNENIREKENTINRLNLTDSFQKFWLPTINLTFETEPHVIGQLYKSQGNPGAEKNGPTGYFGLEVEDYTVFNWGRDYLDYLNEQDTYKRNTQRFKEQRRELRFKIISSYFNLSRLNNFVRLAKKKLRHSSFIYRLAKEKINVKKMRASSFYQAKALFLDAHQEYQESLKAKIAEERTFAELISDKPQAGYLTLENLKYSPLFLKEEEALGFIQKKNPYLRQARFEYKVAKRSYKKQLKENMPLPKISLKLAAYKHSFSEFGSKDEFINTNGNRDVELVAALNMKWRLLGDGGLFNSRSNKRAFLEQEISQIKLREMNRAIKVNTGNTFENISLTEKEISALQSGEKNILKTFNKTLDDYISGKVHINVMKDVLNEYIAIQRRLADAKQNHLDFKLELAISMGQDDLPGQRFEGLGEK